MADTIEKRISDLEEMVGDIPRLINVRFGHVDERLDALEAKIEALPRALAEMLTDMLDARRKS